MSVVDLFEGAALRFEPEHPEPDHPEDVPRGEVTQCRAEHDQVGCGGPDHIACPHDQREPERPDELAAIADAVAQAHAAGAQPGRPDLGHIRPDDSIDGTAEETLRHDQDVEQRHAEDIGMVHIAGQQPSVPRTARNTAYPRHGAPWVDQRGDAEPPEDPPPG